MNLLLLAPSSAVVSVALDCFTTYRGIYVKKTGTEGDMAWITQWVAAKPWRLLLPPLVPAALLALQTSVSNEWVAMVSVGMSIGIALKSLTAIIHNIQVNKGL